MKRNASSPKCLRIENDKGQMKAFGLIFFVSPQPTKKNVIICFLLIHLAIKFNTGRPTLHANT